MITLANGRTGDWFFVNTDFIKSDGNNIDTLHYLNSIYEVIRIQNKVPLFIEDHYQRFQNSALSIKINNLPSISFIKSAIAGLCSRNNLIDGNIRFEIYINEKRNDFALYQIPHFYPAEEMYRNGVKLSSYKIERSNPNIKQSSVNSMVRSKIAGIQQQTGAYEIVLINQFDEVTEGSKSNLYFISDTKIYTAPSELILEGITRKHLINLISKTNYKLVENRIGFSEITGFDGCFITGTSPKILPVCSIDSNYFNVQNKVIRDLMNLFDKHIIEYCKSYVG